MLEMKDDYEIIKYIYEKNLNSLKIGQNQEDFNKLELNYLKKRN